ncbi:HAD-hyrolase-like [Streptoalloteichus tenebrarius]|uniref:HAD-hyrolase-like n=1 Tax=Streptoalloteichus tenebrarius (strain ATCC 17920 / DSM 40477 / JCM 4838 / CBS 697.72 / NBRC 16177 / NCIMB 11028 / NRRL B-12390 / A12253. 1 / ISP 5477) TaxID=1933 RepID=A0ABT1I294_STRSD|nr:HAD-hyrolase-like [Streptoalloteichus tenebrarius]BFF01031.1 hypothetical protein GCM10020241_27060 [Streptoalloteichus tenebrarius]
MTSGMDDSGKYAVRDRDYDRHRDWLGRQGRALPGAVAALAALDAEPRAWQSVLTGNLPEVARIKAQVFGLIPYLDLSTGAYGNGHTDRADLVKIAQHRASERSGDTFDGTNTVLIGDTPHDVAAGTSAGTRVVAVATGKSTASELEAAGATVVLPDLRDTEAVLRAVFRD